MNISHAAARVYAEALIDIGEQTDSLGRIVDDLHAVRELYDGDVEFRRLFTSPRIEAPVKKRAVLKAFEDVLGRPVLGLLAVLIERRRELLLDNVVDQFEAYEDQREGRVHAYVRSAKPISDEERDQLRAKLEKTSGKSVRIHEQVEPELLGGMVVRLGDSILDGSLRSRMARLRREMTAANR